MKNNLPGYEYNAPEAATTASILSSSSVFTFGTRFLTGDTDGTESESDSTGTHHH